MPNFADGRRSVFPGAGDDFGEEYRNGGNEKVSAERWNLISDAVITLQKHTLQVLQTDRDGILGTLPATNRPVMLYKVFTAAITGAETHVKTTVIPGPAFTTAEKALFGGTPLASGNLVHVWVRKISGDTIPMTTFQASVRGPVADLSGDSGIPVAITLPGPDYAGFNIRPTDYAWTFLIQQI